VNFQNWTVIVVEDTYDDIELASAILSYFGVQVHVAHNGVECLNLLNSVTPTCIITDLAMPEMDGWEMLNQLRENSRTRHIPVVAVTAYDSANVGDDAQEAGFDAYFAKPLSARNFMENLARVIAQ
jgi:CheY-like chemotaxis protein